MGNLTPREARLRRHRRIRNRVVGRSDRPRLAVFRSLTHVYAQVIDDDRGRTVASASTTEKDVRDRLEGLKKVAQADLVGRVVAERALAAGIRKVVFDRGGNLYHGRVKALADGARAGGLEF